MPGPDRALRRLRRGRVMPAAVVSVLATSMALVGSYALFSASAGAAAAPAAARATHHQAGNSITAGHAYRHGAVPSLGWMRAHPQEVAALSANDLNYGGGISGVGVTTGSEKVYLVFWGSQWGSQSTDSNGNFTYSGDPQGVAPDLQLFMKGLGTGGETWSGVMTQYCEGVATGTTRCPSTAPHVAYPAGGALAGVWEDNSAASPAHCSPFPTRPA